jgi:hypothetical protein
MRDRPPPGQKHKLTELERVELQAKFDAACTACAVAIAEFRAIEPHDGMWDRACKIHNDAGDVLQALDTAMFDSGMRSNRSLTAVPSKTNATRFNEAWRGLHNASVDLGQRDQHRRMLAELDAVIADSVELRARACQIVGVDFKA